MANLTISIDESDKKYISEFCEQIGISVSGLYNMFTKQVIREGKIPFEIGVERPNRKTVKAMKEGDKLINDQNAKSYTFDEFAEEMKNW
ncbi:MAG: type II toxin-antitoxin system RelB/DinJ family antitoxin [Treponema sp.]|nr:type II toxin-antitoxin system RelB/DinJ family antitoxin [Treponema sp.]